MINGNVVVKNGNEKKKNTKDMKQNIKDASNNGKFNAMNYMRCYVLTTQRYTSLMLLNQN